MDISANSSLQVPRSQLAQPDGKAWARLSQSKGAVRTRLLCFPYAGGGPWIFSRWGAVLGPSFDVCPIHLPGRGIRFLEAPLRSIRGIASAAARALSPHLDAPFALFGHSFGGLVAFEFARALRQLGAREPAALIASASPAPGMGRPRRGLHELDDDRLISALAKMGGTPKTILGDREYMRSVLPTIRADFEALDNYIYRDDASLDCPITAIGGRDDSNITVEQLAAWSDLTRSGFRLRILPGNHFFLNSHEEQLLSLLAHELGGAASALSGN
ncbi:MAG: thioesterase II family protein [Candidatus Binataceae bacterium]